MLPIGGAVTPSVSTLRAEPPPPQSRSALGEELESHEIQEHWGAVAEALFLIAGGDVVGGRVAPVRRGLGGPEERGVGEEQGQRPVDVMRHVAGEPQMSAGFQ